MKTQHSKTEYSYTSIRKNSFFLDWQTQPKNHKMYPKFYQRFLIDDFKELENLNLIGGITYQKEYLGGMYYLRTNPSAGGLYPCEVYLQLRGINGLLSGIYHYEPYNKSLCLLQEIDVDGIEHYSKNKFLQKGIIFLISTVYFRSSWKYRDRSIRYILLDSGHQMGSIYAVLYLMGKNASLVFDFDKFSLNEIFGFRNDEMFICGLSSTVSLDKTAKSLKQKLPYVCGCDYLESNNFVEDSYKQTVIYNSEDIKDIDFFKDIDKDVLKDAILNRRSIRAFRQLPIDIDEFSFIVKNIFEFAFRQNIEIFYTAHRVNGLKQGLYSHNKLIKDGDFSQKSRYLSLEQNLGGESAVTFYFTSKESPDYQKVNILSGFLAQIIYLKAQIKKIGCSGIGAYYDQEAQKFLQIDNNILYLLAIGR